MNIPFPDKKYNIIYADPPWQYDNKMLDCGGALNHFDVMSIDQICNLPVQRIADDDCILFCWGTWTHNFEIHKVIKAWGFEYKTCAFVWVKIYKNGKKVLGMGKYTRSNTEYCLIGIKGKFKRQSKKIQQIIEDIDDGQWTPETIHADLKKHSKKPDEFRNRIMQLCGDLPRIELFARSKIHGWDVWGNDEKLALEPLENY